MRNKHKNDYWKDSDSRSFIENNIELFVFLTNRGFMIPSAGDASCGGRVVDSFTLMPAWIREQITVDGNKLTECDYTALHPNIAIHLYHGSESYLTHANVAERTNIDLKMIKVEHLSFFNKKWLDMMQSPLFGYYSKNEADMLANIYRDKTEHGHKITSRKMFRIEVNIMTDVIQYLNAKEVYVLYVYDALLCEEKDKSLVIETMNRIILEHGVKTRVKNDELPVVVKLVEPVPEPLAVEIPKYSLNERVKLYEVLPLLSNDVDDTMKVIYDVNQSSITMIELVNYFEKQMKEQKYNDYDGVLVTSDRIAMLKSLIRQ